MLKILRVQGDSMTPEYQSGDFVLIAGVKHPKAGDVIVFHNQFYGTLIKKIEKITEQGIYVIGTGENSLDSRRLGPVSPDKVQGKVIWHIRR
jgi:phage repressor protein C with HTH and peptisase S24 domain